MITYRTRTRFVDGLLYKEGFSESRNKWVVMKLFRNRKDYPCLGQCPGKDCDDCPLAKRN